MKRLQKNVTIILVAHKHNILTVCRGVLDTILCAKSMDAILWCSGAHKRKLFCRSLLYELVCSRGHGCCLHVRKLQLVR